MCIRIRPRYRPDKCSQKLGLIEESVPGRTVRSTDDSTRTSARISVWVSKTMAMERGYPYECLRPLTIHGYPYGYSCGCPCRIIRATDSLTRDLSPRMDTHKL